jgi:hypothetical protein
MQRTPRFTVSGLMVTIGISAVVTLFLTQHGDQRVGGLLSLALIAIVPSAIALRFGPRRWRRAFALPALGVGVQLIVVVAGTAGVVASLRSPPRPTKWPDEASLLTGLISLSILMLASTVALVGRDNLRRIAWGAAAAGWSVVLLGLMPMLSDPPIGSLLLADFLHDLYPRVYLQSVPPSPPPMPTLHDVDPAYLQFQRVGHYVAVIVAALFGGLLARFALRAASGGDRTIHRADFGQPNAEAAD